jgi:hypothetical protein
MVHGLSDPLVYFRMAPRYSLKGREHLIRCPVFVCSAEGDDLSIDAPKLYGALTCPKQYVQFSSAEGAGQHCESGARTVFHARAFDWLDQVLSTTPPRSAHEYPREHRPGPDHACCGIPRAHEVRGTWVTALARSLPEKSHRDAASWLSWPPRRHIVVVVGGRGQVTGGISGTSVAGGVDGSRGLGSQWPPAFQSELHFIRAAHVW